MEDLLQMDVHDSKDLNRTTFSWNIVQVNGQLWASQPAPCVRFPGTMLSNHKPEDWEVNVKRTVWKEEGWDRFGLKSAGRPSCNVRPVSILPFDAAFSTRSWTGEGRMGQPVSVSGENLDGASPDDDEEEGRINRASGAREQLLGSAAGLVQQLTGLDDHNLPNPCDCCDSLDGLNRTVSWFLSLFLVTLVCFVHIPGPASSGLVVLRVALLVLVVLAVCGFWGGICRYNLSSFNVGKFKWKQDDTGWWYCFQLVVHFLPAVVLYQLGKVENLTLTLNKWRKQNRIRTLAFCQVGQYSWK
ncbi:hypothetical protein C8J55DRAFT_489436 [Lentinula edodes]|uniref:Uncharacterized protein n=1 Tax=Lentinula lateritia TaxID=40482 RepID=A0A9W9DPC0_9AGAR|nr:hypothetical protein C8J55DRAFT_489436 [Lentinula edodes]